MDQQGAALIEEHVRHMLVMIGFDKAKVRCQIVQDNTINVDIEAGDDGKLLIGTQGSHLLALQHVLRRLLRRHIKEDTRVLVDVNKYRVRRERTLLELAQEVARRAHRTGRVVVMRPMPASERRTIHTALAQQKNIQTESLGEEPNRRVLVRPVFL